MTVGRTAAVCGILWVLLVIVGNDIVGQSGELPGIDAAPQEYADWLAAHSGVRSWVAAWLDVAGIAFGLVFFALIGQSIAPSGVASRIATVAATTALAIKLGSGAFWLPLLIRGDQHLDPSIVRTLVDMNGAAFVLTFLPLGVFAIATSVGGLRTGLFRRWVAWFGGIAGGALLVGMPLAIDGPGFIGMAVFLLWILVASVSLLVPRRTAVPRPGSVSLPLSP